MATLEDTNDPYWCAAWNQGCAFLYRAGYLCKVRILDGDNQSLPTEEHEVLERLRRVKGQPDSRLPPLLWLCRDQCCPDCQGQSILWRGAERRQLPRRFWRAVLCCSCYSLRLRGRRAAARS